MNQPELEKMLIELVCKVQEISGREKVQVRRETRPVVDLPGFDSLNGVEVTVDVLDRVNLDLEFNNVLVEDEKALTIAEAATRLLNCTKQ